MTATGPTPAGDRAFEVRFDEFAGTEHNLDLRGEGTLFVQSKGPVYCFCGRRRSFLPGKRTELEFSPAEISDVVGDDRIVRFTTLKGVSGSKRKPFVFFCRDRREADEIVALLPPSPAGVGGGQAVMNKIRLLPASAHWLGSITNLVVLINVAVFVAGIAFGGGGFLTGRSLAEMPLVLGGANNAAATTQGEWWRLVTSMFIHRDPVHLLCNLWALFQAGHLLERLLGRSLFGLVYLGAGLAGGMASIGWNGDKVWSIGASGAVFGVYGALFGCIATLRHRGEITASVFNGTEKSAALFACYNILFGVAIPGIDNAAHVGGLLGGLGFGLLAVRPIDLAARAREFLPRLGLSALALGALLAAGVVTAPRFDYRVREELAWAEFAKTFQTEELKVTAKFQAALREVPRKRVGVEVFRGAAASHAAFYTTAAAKAKALAFTPGLRTDKNRLTFVDAIEKKITGLRRGQEMNEAAGALGGMEAEFKQGLASRMSMLRELGNAPEAAQFARREILPYYDSWESKLEAVPLPLPAGAPDNSRATYTDDAARLGRQLSEARQQVLREIRSGKAAITSAVAQTEAALRVTELPSALEKEYNALVAREPRVGPNAPGGYGERVAFLRGEFLPFLAAWRTRIEALSDTPANLARAKHQLLGVLDTREAAVAKALAESEAGLALTTAGSEFAAANQAMLQRLPSNPGTNGIPAEVAQANAWLRDEYLPFLETWRQRYLAIDVPSSGGWARPRAELVKAIDVAAAVGTQQLASGEVLLGVVTMAEEFAGEHRTLSAARPTALDRQADGEAEIRWWREKYLPFIAAWREKFAAISLRSDAVAEAQDKALRLLKEKEAAARTAISDLQAVGTRKK